MGRSAESKARQLEYDKKMTRFVAMKLNKKTDADILAWLSAQTNMQGYIKELIRRDMPQSMRNDNQL